MECIDCIRKIFRQYEYVDTFIKFTWVDIYQKSLINDSDIIYEKSQIEIIFLLYIYYSYEKLS